MTPRGLGVIDAHTGSPDSRRQCDWSPILRCLPGVGLDATGNVAVAGRFDRKYLVDLDDLDDLVAGMVGLAHVLDIDGRRTTTYTTTYFDTPDLATFRSHRQGRRRRYKIRMRRYGDDPSGVLEVKYRGDRGRTVKVRRPSPGGVDDTLDTAAMAFVSSVVRDAYAMDVPADLVPTVSTQYERTTLVDLDSRSRITIDRNLRISPAISSGDEPPPPGFAHQETVNLGHRYAIVETKSPAPRSPAHGRLSALGARPERLSKYCLGVAALRPEVAVNRWHRAFTRLTAR